MDVDQLRADVVNLAYPHGRMAGTRGHAQAREYILGRIQQVALEPYAHGAYEFPYPAGEIKLTNVARASLEELLTDYRDFLRTRGLREWDKNSQEALYVRQLSASKIPPPASHGTQGTHTTHVSCDMSPESHLSHAPVTFDTFLPFFETRPPEVLANIVICLIHQTNYLLDRQLKRLEKDFIEHGGLRERMTRARLQHRSKQQGSRT